MADPTTKAADSAPDAPVLGQRLTRIGFTQYAILVAAGAFATTMAQPQVVGRLPLTFLLKNHLHLKADAVAIFFFWATMPWNLKPFAGILTDAFPLFGTRRRHYMMLGSGFAGACWALMSLVPHEYSSLLGMAVLVNVFMVIASTVMGGLMVEAGQAYGASGRMTSLRQGVQSVVTLITGPVAGWLASRAFPLTSGLAAALLIALAVITFLVLREPAHATRNVEKLLHAGAELVRIVRSPTLLAAAALLFLVYISPGFSTPLTYRQTDVFHFPTQFIGNLALPEGIAGFVAAALYALLCRRLKLRPLLIIGIVGSTLGTLLYLLYAHPSGMMLAAVRGASGAYEVPRETVSTVILLHSAAGLTGVLAELALMDLAVRSTPPGCEALGFALMMSVRNFGIGLSDVLGSKLLDQFHWSFQNLVLINAATTALVLVFIPLLPRAIMNRHDGEGVGS
jgi:hypothetical protein